jgi:uncharacterized iron-regulated membrane protein
MSRNLRSFLIAVLGLALLTVAGCAAGPTRWVDHPAGFWAGLWHGFIIVIAFIISLFTDSVQIYARNNSGGWYDFGFVLGAMIMLSGSGCKKWKKRLKKEREKEKEKEWEKIGQQVEEKVRRGIKSWLDEEQERDKEWEEIGRKIEEKIKRELRNWAESD